jgi:hypothetical protein
VASASQKKQTKDANWLRRTTQLNIDLNNYRGFRAATNQRVTTQELVRIRCTTYREADAFHQSNRLLAVTFVDECDRHNIREKKRPRFKVKCPFTKEQLGTKGQSADIIDHWLTQYQKDHSDLPAPGFKKLCGLGDVDTDLYKSFKMHFTVFFETFFISDMPFDITIEQIIARALLFSYKLIIFSI